MDRIDGDTSHTINLETFVDQQSIGAFHISLVTWPLLVMIADGFDLVVMGFAAPEIIKSWGIERGSMAPALTSSLVGMLVGTPIFGYFGDRYGRKTLVIVSTLLFGITTLAVVWATTVSHLVVLRFLTGIGLAGIVPNATALVSEMMPRRVRGGYLIVVQLGVQLGAVITGLVAAQLVSRFGWQILFYVGGLFPLALALVLVWVLPESMKYLSLHSSRRDKLLKLATRIDPTFRGNESTKFVVQSAEFKTTPSPSVAFQNGMHIMTPLLWGLAMVSLFINLLIASWAPTVLMDVGLSAPSAAVATSLYALGGLAGSLILIVGFNRYGFLIVLLSYLLAAPTVMLIGQASVGATVSPALMFLSGMFLSGPQSAVNSALGLLYPTPIRASSAGWGLAVGRLGAIAGPLVGGYLLSQQVSGASFFRFIGIPVLLGILLLIGLVIQARKRFAGWHLNESSVEPAPS